MMKIYSYGDSLLIVRVWPDSSFSNVLDPQSIPDMSILADRLMISYSVPNRTIRFHPRINFISLCSFSSYYV